MPQNRQPSIITSHVYQINDDFCFKLPYATVNENTAAACTELNIENGSLEVANSKPII